MPTYYRDQLPDEETRRMIQERGLDYNVVDRPPAPAPQRDEEDEGGGDIYRTPGQGVSQWPAEGGMPAVAFNPQHVGGLVDASTDYYEQARLGNVQGANRALDTWNMARRKSGMPDYIPERSNQQIAANAPQRPAASTPPASRPPQAAAPAPRTPSPSPAVPRSPMPSVPQPQASVPRSMEPPPPRRTPPTLPPQYAAQMAQRRAQMWPVRQPSRLPTWSPMPSRSRAA